MAHGWCGLSVDEWASFDEMDWASLIVCEIPVAFVMAQACDVPGARQAFIVAPVQAASVHVPGAEQARVIIGEGGHP